MSNTFAVVMMTVVAAQTPVAKTAEISLRQMAVTSVTPEYPASSVKAGVSGIAVADVIAAATGIVQSIEVLEAPDQAIADAVRAALNQWKFSAFRYPMQAKLTFYFRIEQGKGRVLNPQDMPGGPAFAPRPAGPTYTPENPPPVVKPPAPQPARTIELRDENTTAISFEELQKLTGASRPTILDVGDRASFKRGHLDGAINIPYDEVLVRGPIELRGREPLVIDCTQQEAFHCNVADHVLKEAGIKKIRILRR